MNKSKIAGTSWESACVAWLHEQADVEPRYKSLGYAERRALRGNNDTGDLIIPSPFVVMSENKNEKLISLATYADEVRVQTANARADVGFAWVKRRGKGVAQSYVVMDPPTLLKLLFAGESG